MLDQKHDFIPNSESQIVINSIREDVPYGNIHKRIFRQVKQYGRSREAVTETIRICKDRDVLRKFLAGREKEVISIMMALRKILWKVRFFPVCRHALL